MKYTSMLFSLFIACSQPTEQKEVVKLPADTLPTWAAKDFTITTSGTVTIDSTFMEVKDMATTDYLGPKHNTPSVPTVDGVFYYSLVTNRFYVSRKGKWIDVLKEQYDKEMTKKYPKNWIEGKWKQD